jgi:glycolate oxidase iron-sulfur subunit
MERVRAEWVATHGDPLVLRVIFQSLLPHPDRLTRVMRLLSLGKRSGLADVAQRLGVLRWIHAALDGAAGLVATMPASFLRDRLPAMGFERTSLAGHGCWLLRRPERASGPRVLYFIGCGTNYQVPRQGEAGMLLLQHAGCEVVVADNVCCGLPPLSYGDRPAAEHLARHNVALLRDIPFDALVTDCGSCTAFLHRWPELLADDPLREAAESIAARCKDLSAFLGELALPAAQHASDVKVTYHDPCHLVRGVGVRDEPRRLLTDVAGLELSELREADWCCGGAGSYNIAHPELSLDILSRKQHRIQETGADIVATSCPACIIQLSYGMRRAGLSTPVRHVAELTAERLGLMRPG